MYNIESGTRKCTEDQVSFLEQGTASDKRCLLFLPDSPIKIIR